jgi:hypothetical protein
MTYHKVTVLVECVKPIDLYESAVSSVLLCALCPEDTMVEEIATTPCLPERSLNFTK